MANVRDETKCVGALILDGQRILLAHRKADRPTYPDVWDIPGGHVEPGETDLEALKRELREELGVEACNLLTPPFQTFAEGGVCLSVWLLTDWRGTVRNVATDEHDEIRWVESHQLAELRLAHPGYTSLFHLAWERTARGK